MPSDTMFERLISHYSGIEFNNELIFTKELNPYTYRNFFNGGGVAVGDINNDGLVDLYFSGNQVSNSLQLNTFSEIGRLAGVEATDWSWTTLIADLDNDGHNDIFVTNGIVKDLTDLDYVNDRMNLERLRAVVEEDKPISILFDEMPSTPLSNYAFSGTAGLGFNNIFQGDSGIFGSKRDTDIGKYDIVE